MALLTVAQRKAFFKELGLGEYNAENVKKFQRAYMWRKSDADGIYGPDTDNLLRTYWNVTKHSKNFSVKEFRCECGGDFCCGFPSFMKEAEIKNIQAIRDHWNRPVTVTCGLRCYFENKRVKGIRNSKHLSGRAIDFYQKGVTDTLTNRKNAIEWIRISLQML